VSSKGFTMMAVGDLILSGSESNSIFDLALPTLKSADLLVGQLETAFTERGVTTLRNLSGRGSNPKYMSVLQSAGFNVLTFAGTHVWDSGIPGIEDTLEGLRNLGIAVVGVGMNLDEARKPVIIDRNGTRIGFLAYDTVGPEVGWATPRKPGSAYVEVITHYQAEGGGMSAGMLPVIYTFTEPASLKAMVDDIQKLKPLCDILVVSLHKGVPHQLAKLAMYEQPISYAAVDAGADLILAHHPHLLRGVEYYQGKPIFHGLGRFAFALPAALKNTKGTKDEWRKKMEERIEEYRGGLVKREDPTFPYPPASFHTIIAKIAVEGGKIPRLSYLPCAINDQQQPEIVRNNEKGRPVFDHMEKITREAGLNARYEWEGDEVVIHEQ
jgi:poly-gamma-glutamate capsule biosynthesis protein CapA/YwtB (metallophosphatase superfamily)